MAITTEDKKEIINRHESGESFNTLGREFGVSSERIRQIYMAYIYNMHKPKLKRNHERSN